MMRISVFFGLLFSLLFVSSCLFDSENSSNKEDDQSSPLSGETYSVASGIIWVGENCDEHDQHHYSVKNDSVVLDSLIPESGHSWGEMKPAEYPKEDCIGYYMEYVIDSTTMNRKIQRVSAELRTFSNPDRGMISKSPLVNVKYFSNSPSEWTNIYLKSGAEEWGCVLESVGYVDYGNDTLYVVDYSHCDIYSNIVLDDRRVVPSNSNFLDSLDIDGLYKYILNDFFWVEDTRNDQRLEAGFVNSKSYGLVAPLKNENWKNWSGDVNLPSKKYWVKWIELDDNKDTIISIQDSLAFNEPGFAYCVAATWGDASLNTDSTIVTRPEIKKGSFLAGPIYTGNRCSNVSNTLSEVSHSENSVEWIIDLPILNPDLWDRADWEFVVNQYPLYDENSYFQNP